MHNTLGLRKKTILKHFNW